MLGLRPCSAVFGRVAGTAARYTPSQPGAAAWHSHNIARPTRCTEQQFTIATRAVSTHRQESPLSKSVSRLQKATQTWLPGKIGTLQIICITHVCFVLNSVSLSPRGDPSADLEMRYGDRSPTFKKLVSIRACCRNQPRIGRRDSKILTPRGTTHAFVSIIALLVGGQWPGASSALPFSGAGEWRVLGGPPSLPEQLC